MHRNKTYVARISYEISRIKQSLWVNKTTVIHYIIIGKGQIRLNLARYAAKEEIWS